MKNSVISCALSVALCSCAWAVAPPAVGIPEVYVGGVFSRPVGPAVQPLQTSRFRPALPFLFDGQGRANQIMVLLDFANPAIVGTEAPPVGVNGLLPAEQIRREATVLDKLNTNSNALRAQFGSPLYSDYLLWETRQSLATRSRFKADSPSERLERYLLLTYDTVDAASAALTVLSATLGVLAVEQDQKLKFASVPYNDSYAQWQGTSAVAATYQWGHYAMNFINALGQEGAHDVHQGHGYIATLDGLAGQSPNLPADLSPNVRHHLAFGAATTNTYAIFHGTFVNSIVAATANNGPGIAGACPSCSLLLYEGGSVSSASSVLSEAKWSAPVVNMSFGLPNPVAMSSNVLDSAIAAATANDVAMFAASGNEKRSQPDYPARNSSVLSVGGAQQNSPTGPWPIWDEGLGSTAGANSAGINGVVGPARDVVSLVPFPGASIAPIDASLACGDSSPDISGQPNDGVAACRGTSFATPYVASLGAILRSINPRLSRDAIYAAIRASSGQGTTDAVGSGLPNALSAVYDVINQTPNRLTPLFSLWSAERSDYFYTTVPQMAVGARYGLLKPGVPTGTGYVSGIGNYITGYDSFPNDDPAAGPPSAGAWIFTTKLNPVDANAPLVPLYRLSWKCSDYSPTPPAVCSSNPYHMDTTYTTAQAGINAFMNVGYKLDGIEGFIYPKTAAQPSGAVRLMRKYAVSRDDHAIFPENEFYTYAIQGYTENSGSDWLGYVYPNSGGTTPAIQ